MGAEKDLIDLSYLEELSGGNAGYIAQVVAIFLKHAGEDLEKLHLLIHKYKSWDEAYGQAHKLKSGLGVVRIKGMLEDIMRLEVLLKSSDHSGVPEIADKLLQTFRSAEPVLREIVKDVGEDLA